MNFVTELAIYLTIKEYSQIEKDAENLARFVPAALRSLMMIGTP